MWDVPIGLNSLREVSTRHARHAIRPRYVVRPSRSSQPERTVCMVPSWRTAWLIHQYQVKCSGQRSGCDRCRSKTLTCVYAKPKRRPKSPKATAPPAFNPTGPAAASASSNDAELASKPPNTILSSDQTISSHDLLPTSPELVDHGLGLANGLPCPESLHEFDGDAAFDTLWDTYANGASNLLELEDDYMMRGGRSPSDPRSEPSRQPMLSLSTASIQEMTASSHEPAVAQQDPPNGELSAGMNSFLMTL